MRSTTQVAGSAQRWGPLWGARPHDWAATEAQQVPTYEEAIRRIGLTTGQNVLEVGCGSGVFLRIAARRGAVVAGIDASETLVELARARVPGADVRVGEMQMLPYADDAFDVVCGFNSFFFADDMTAALREAGRVAKPGAPVVIQVWGRPERCGLDAMKDAIGRLLPGPGRAAPPPFWQSGVLEEIADDAGLAPERSYDLRWSYEYADEPALLQSMSSVASPRAPPAGAYSTERHSAFVGMYSVGMTYVIVGSCIKDDSCIEVCPVDCIHPRLGAPDFETAEQLYIDPGECIDCDACVEACPVDAIFSDFEVPEKYGYALELNAEFFAESSTAERTAA